MTLTPSDVTKQLRFLHFHEIAPNVHEMMNYTLFLLSQKEHARTNYTIAWIQNENVYQTSVQAINFLLKEQVIFHLTSVEP